MRAVDADAVKEIICNHVKGMRMQHNMIYEVENMPTINVADANVGKWTPCSERMPEDEGMYLITSKVLNKTKIQYVFYDKNICMFICNGNALAWMPLPEPYKTGYPPERVLYTPGKMGVLV